MMHMFHESCGRLGELVHRLAVCHHGWHRLRAHVILLFPHCFTHCAPERETLSAPEPTMVKHSESISARRLSNISMATVVDAFAGQAGHRNAGGPIVRWRPPYLILRYVDVQSIVSQPA